MSVCEWHDFVVIELLRPVAWIEELELKAQSIVDLDLPELGASGPAVILEVAASPPIVKGAGQVVTGTFCHWGHNLVDVVIDGGEPIGCTATHLFWSEDRLDFVPAGDLQPGETLRTHDDRLVSLTRVTPRAGSAPVYNLEVNLEHVYYVGNDGILVHNTCPLRKALGLATGQKKNGEVLEAHHLVPQKMKAHARGKAADEARKLLRRNRIDLHSKENGVALTRSVHHNSGLHSTPAVQEVLRRLRQAENLAAPNKAGRSQNVKNALEAIKNEMQSGNFYFPPL